MASYNKNPEYPAMKTTASIIYKIHVCTVPDQTAPKSSQIQAYTEVNNTAPDRNAQYRAPQSVPVPFTMTKHNKNPMIFWETKTISLSNPAIIYDWNWMLILSKSVWIPFD